ncbi:MAG: methyltransferase domain-containing protein [Desulfatirhabdiaceae bacterium]
MISNNNPEINVEELMQRIRAEVAKRKAASVKSESHTAVEKPQFSAVVEKPSGEELPAFTLSLPEVTPFAIQPGFQAKADGQYHVNDLLCYHDQAFVTAAYRTILHRSPDTGGYLHFLNKLRNGCAKVDILGRLRYSKEGRTSGIKISGLALPFVLQQVYRIPVFGRFAQILSAIWHLPHLERNQRTFENHAVLLMEQAQNHFSESCRKLNQSLAQLEQAIRQLQNTKAGLNSIELIKGDIQDLQITKVNQDDLNTAIGNIQLSHQEAVSELLNTKAALDSIELIKGQIQDLQNTKVNQNDLNTAIGNIQLSHQEAVSELLNTKAALDSIELIKGDIQDLQITKVNQSALDETRHLLTQAIETRAERHELTAITNHLVGLVQARLRKEDLQPVAQLLDQLQQHVEELNQSKAVQSAFVPEQTQNHSDLDALQQNIQQALNAAKIQGSTVSQSALDEALLPIKAQTHDIKRNLLDQDRRLGLLLEEARKRLPAPISTDQIETMLTEDEHRLDAMYASFEDRFRGTREDIKQRQSIYLPIVLEAKAGSKDAPILDLGCGRGEWLEILHHEGLIAKGVDINRVFLEGCRELELDVVEQDAIAYLRSLKSNSIGAVTAFHLIEHLPLKTLIAFMDESLRVLQPEGLVILETPNPANMQVGSCNFYFDPTHRNPLPGPLTQYLLEARGFCRTQFMPLHPFGETPDRLTHGDLQVQRLLNQFFFGPQDYAAIAYKSNLFSR